jgi:hypothetical protein
MHWLRRGGGGGGGGEGAAECEEVEDDDDDPLRDTRTAAGHGSFFPDQVVDPNPSPYR